MVIRHLFIFQSSSIVQEPMGFFGVFGPKKGGRAPEIWALRRIRSQATSALTSKLTRNPVDFKTSRAPGLSIRPPPAATLRALGRTG